MNKLLYILSIAAISAMTACTGSSTENGENATSDTYKDIEKRYYNADSGKKRAAIEEEARTTLTASEFDKFMRKAHPERYRDPKTSYNRAEKEAVEAYVAEHNRLCRMYHAAPAGSALRDSLMTEMTELENLMRNQHQREAYEAFLLLRDSI